MTSHLPIRLFYSYSHKDEKLLDRLVAHLGALRKQGVIEQWHDRKIGAGREWAGEIDRNLEAAQIILLLISADFCNSDYCQDLEVKNALERHEAGSAVVIPVFLKPCDWKGFPFGKLQGVPTDAKPVTKWSNRDEAFTIIAQRIREAAKTLKAGIAEQSSKTADNLPARNPHFTGRAGLLEQVHQNLANGREVALTALHGLGGIGKSQAALEYAWRHRNAYCVVWWLRAEKTETLVADLAALAIRIGAARANTPNIAEAAKAALATLEDKQGWLLIYDNVEKEEDVTLWLPRTGGHVLLTSRDAIWHRVKSLPVDILPKEDAVDFLTERVGETDAAAEELARELGFLPLALEQAAAFMVERGWGCKAYLEVFRARRGEMLALGKAHDRTDTITTTWALNFDAVEEVSPVAAQLLTLCAFLAPDDIPLDLLARGAKKLPSPLADAFGDHLIIGNAVAVLRHWSLVSAKDLSLSVHRLVQEVVRGRLAPSGALTDWAGNAVRCLHAAFPFQRDDLTSWPTSKRLLLHAEAAATQAETLNTHQMDTAFLLNKLGVCLSQFGLYERAEAIKRRGHNLSKLSGHPSIEALFASNLAVSLLYRKKFKEAKDILERIIKKDKSASKHELSSRLDMLGNAKIALGDISGGKKAMEQALQLSEQALGANHPNIANQLSNLAWLYHDLGEQEKALQLHRRTLHLLEETKNPAHPEIGYACAALGEALAHTGRLEEGRDLLARAALICISVLGDKNAVTLGVKSKLARVDEQLSSQAPPLPASNRGD